MSFDLLEAARAGGPVGEVARLQYLKQLSDHTCHYYTHTIRDALQQKIEEIEKAIQAREKILTKRYGKKKVDEHLFGDPELLYLLGRKGGLEEALRMM